VEPWQEEVMCVWDAIVGKRPATLFVEMGEGDGEEEVDLRTFFLWNLDHDRRDKENLIA